MPLKLTHSAGNLGLVWEADDGSFTASWRVPKDADEQEILSTLEKACAFVRAQRGEKERKIEEIKTFLINDALASAAPEAIPMGPPSPNDRPSDGGPVNGWAAEVGRPTIPAHLQGGEWGVEYI